MIACEISRRPVAGEGIDLVRADCIAHRFPPRFHPDVLFGVITAGRYKLQCASGTYVACEGDIIVLNANEVHTCESLAELPWSYRMFHIPERLVPRLSAVGGSSTERAWFPAAVVREASFAHRLAVLHEKLQRRPNADAAGEFVALLRQFTIGHAVPGVTGGSEARRPHDRARAFLDEHYAEPIRMAELGRICGVSVFHLIHAFKQAIGLPPAAYLRQVRIARAQDMLRLGCPVAHVARATGFTDQSHFTRRFKQTLGFPPGAYLRAVLSGSAHANGRPARPAYAAESSQLAWRQSHTPISVRPAG